MRDLASKLAASQILGPVTIAADSTPADIDLQGYDSATIFIGVGAGGITFDTTNKIEFVLTHADDNGSGAAGTYTNVAVTDINGAGAPTTVTNGIVKALTAAHASADVTEIGYVGGKRFIKFLADFSGTHGTGTPLSILLVKGHPRLAPAA